MKKLISALLSVAFSLSFICTYAYAYSGTFILYQEKPSGKHYGLYKHDNVMYLYDKSGENYKRYTGFTKTQKGNKRYYVTGDLCKGWRKIDGKWYYFDHSNGNAATGTKTIGGKKYIFNSDGSWSGKRSRSAAYPSDFFVEFRRSNMDSTDFYYIDGKNKTLEIKHDDGTVTSRKMSAADVQAFYSMIIDSGITDIKAPISGFYIENNYLLTGYTPPAYEGEDEADDPADCDYAWTDPEKYRFDITCGGKSFAVSGDDTAFLFLYSDETASRFCHAICSIYDYNKGA
ncbi:MAG: hypothetical protein ACI4I2_06515 [Oscillospiraceae bacterium]